MFEREITSSEALFTIMSTIHTLGLHPVAHYADPTNLVATAELFDKHNNLVESGSGKGPDALVGALAESIEHFSTFHLPTDDRVWQRSDIIATQKAATHDGLLTNLPLTDELIECVKLTTLDNNETIFIPSILLSPQTANNTPSKNSSATKFLNRYSSNSGIAYGCTEAEALLHGTLEIIERHILSLFFMAVCAIGPKIRLYKPSKALLRKSLQNNESALELADKLQIIIIKDLMSVYFSVAFPKNGPGDLHLSPIGSGCSLDICTAIQRAVTEQLQSDLLYDTTEEASDRKTLEILSGSKNLKHLIDFSPIKNLKLPTINEDLPSAKSTVPEQIYALSKTLLNTNKKIFRRTVARFSKNSIVSQTYIPGLERFNIIRNGLLVAPQHILRGV
ncbi:YcaO-like family protein [Pseudomonas mandelii]|uniref:YcaO-like family protein n=1 Tax=Pseudomonas mandelii TaxID=75612 RepID=UPI00224A5A15|nr:YcaO-like family protein [Pseudomonas mandelii]MCX2898184.1 YcaO-like family protein [Pseudomonas mandelii]